VRGLLQQVFPTHFLFGSGDITDSYDEKSGQVDVVVSNPTAFSLPIIPEGPRLFLAESVAAVIEVKSDVSRQWNEVVSTAQKVAKLRRLFARQFYEGFLELEEFSKQRGSNSARLPDWVSKAAKAKDQLGEKIPLIVVGYRGWQEEKVIREKIKATDGLVAAVFNLDTQLFCTSRGMASGSYAMLNFLDVLLSQLQLVSEAMSLAVVYGGFAPRKGVEEMLELERKGQAHPSVTNTVPPDVKKAATLGKDNS
jgi:hypothetical protein